MCLLSAMLISALLFVLLRPITFAILQVDLVTISHNDSLSSFQSFGHIIPPIEIAIREVNDLYNDSLKMGVLLTTKEKWHSSPEIIDNVQNFIARWHYTQRRPANQVLSVVASPGEKEEAVFSLIETIACVSQALENQPNWESPVTFESP